MRKLLVTTIALFGCEEKLQPVRCRDVDTCIADPRPHCVRMNGCQDDSDCPSGLACPEDNESTACAEPPGRLCVWIRPRIEALALVSGFATRSMMLEVKTSPKLELSWENPRDALFVACGVFTCNPVVKDRDVQNDADKTADDHTLQTIANVDSCLLEHYVTDSSRSGLALGANEETPKPACAATTLFNPVIDFLAAACWAYDDNRIVAASDLVEIPYDAARDVLPDIPTTSCAVDDRACFEPTARFFGMCRAGVCQPRCSSAADCARAASDLLGRPLGTTCEWTCRDVPTSTAGVCEPL